MEITRSIKFDLIIADDKLYRPVIDSIRLYRDLCRKAFSACLMAEIAGADLLFKEGNPVLKPTQAARDILTTAFDKEGKAHLYQLRDWILGEESPRLESDTEKSSWNSFVWDSLRGDVSSQWSSRDPTLHATRGYLAMQGARGVAQFRRRGIGFPSQRRPNFHEHAITLHWDKNIGHVEFRLGKLDGGRYRVWKALRDKLPGYKLGTLYLSELNGRLFVTISYKTDIEKPILSTENELLIKFTDIKSEFIKISGPGKFDSDTVSAEEICGVLEQIKIRRDRWESRRRAVGNPRRPWGSKKGFEATQKVVSRNTEHRDNFTKERNHLLTRRIIDNAIRWNCGKISVEALPENWFGEPWQWAQFSEFLKYKAHETGIEIIFNS